MAANEVFLLQRKDAMLCKIFTQKRIINVWTQSQSRKSLL